VSFFDELWEAGAFRRRSIPLTVGAFSFVLSTWLLVNVLKEDATLGVVIVSVVWVAVLAALFTGVGRHYAIGFITAIVAGSVMTMGALLLVWGFPVIAAYHAVSRTAAHHEDAARFAALNHTRVMSRREWTNARRAEPPVLAHGQILANTVNECAAAYREIDSVGSYPRNVDELEMTSCAGLAATSADTSFSRFIENDRGWRWTYAPGAADSLGRVTDYRVRVFEDPAIDRVSPQYVTDATGAVRELDRGKPPTLVATPLESLEQLRRCVAAVPDQRVSETSVERTYSHYDSPLDEVVHRCKTLRGVVSFSQPYQKYGEITVSVRRNANVVDTVGAFSVSLVPVDERQFIFELSASPIPSSFHAGSRRYFISRDGLIHVRNGAPATAADPVMQPVDETGNHDRR
jgi:hypothetical protein